MSHACFGPRRCAASRSYSHSNFVAAPVKNLATIRGLVACMLFGPETETGGDGPTDAHGGMMQPCDRAGRLAKHEIWLSNEGSPSGDAVDLRP